MADTIFDRRLVMITGKGGVGKTTIASAIAVAAKERGLRTLLIEVGATDNLPQLFGVKIPLYEITRIEDGLYGFRLDPFHALEDYLITNMKVEWAAKKFLQTDVIRYLTQAAPGWRELITLGKIWYTEQAVDKKTKKPEWDLLVVDAPATGHGISFLRVPQVILETMKYGPIHTNTQRVQDLLTDTKRTLLSVVTLPEEMPINEAIEIHAAAKNVLKIPFGHVFVNMMPPKVLDADHRALGEKFKKDKKARATVDEHFEGGSEALIEAAEATMERRALAESYVAEGQTKIDADFIELPYIYQDPMDRDGLARIARAITEATD